MKFNLNQFIKGNFIGLVLVASYLLASGNIAYGQPQNNYQSYQSGNNNNWGKYGNNHPTPTPTPSCTPTPSQTSQPTPTPVAQTTPTPAVTVTPTPSNNNGGGGGSPVIYGPGSSTQAPGAATCNVAFAAPILQGYNINYANKTETYSWWTSTANNITKQSVEYGYQIGNPIYGADNLPTNQTSLVINGLNMNQISWARVGAWQNGCVEWSNWFN